MRNFFDAILAFIIAESLTDNEFATTVATTPTYDQASYDDLARVLTSRSAVSTVQARLVACYKAQGVDVTAASTANSNIFLGAVL